MGRPPPGPRRARGECGGPGGPSGSPAGRVGAGRHGGALEAVGRGALQHPCAAPRRESACPASRLGGV
eukprot:9785773-Lingulodinium_polyedra.AAC.1